MAGSILTILDDIAALMDDVSVATKVATQKTAGILGDDLAVNAEKATGFLSSREIPVLWKITKGSLLNKVIIVPIVFLLQWLYEPVISIILIIGGFYLAYEGVEKIVHFLVQRKDETPAVAKKELKSNDELILEEKSKVKNAVITDFILSLEIVIIALSAVIKKPLPVQIMTVSIVAIIATIGVYGVVALIVRMDDAGYKILRKSKNKGFGAMLGKGLVMALPVIIKLLSIVGTIALMMVSGGIFVHQFHFLHDLWPSIPTLLKEIVIAFIAGLMVLAIVHLFKKFSSKMQHEN